MGDRLDRASREVAVALTIEDRVGVCNVRDTLSDAAAEESLREWLREAPEIGGLLEWGRSRDDILDKVASGHLDHGRGDKGGGPLVWNKTRYSPLRIRTKVLVGGGFVGRLPGRRSTLGPSYATVGVFHDDESGDRVTIISAHLTAEVQDRHGRYHADKAHQARVRRHKAERRALGRLVLAHRVRGNRVHVVLDSNFDGMQLPPLVSCWDHRPGGTLGSRAVDVVFAPQAAHAVRTVATKSDHRAVVAVYRRK